jgi:hypothetical protein
MDKKIHEREKVCIECGMPLQKLKTLVKTKFASKLIMFEDVLEFKQSIITCYGRHKIVTLQHKVPKAQVWAIIEVITSCLNPMVTSCVMN